MQKITLFTVCRIKIVLLLSCSYTVQSAVDIMRVGAPQHISRNLHTAYYCSSKVKWSCKVRCKRMDPNKGSTATNTACPVVTKNNMTIDRMTRKWPTNTLKKNRRNGHQRKKTRPRQDSTKGHTDNITTKPHPKRTMEKQMEHQV